MNLDNNDKNTGIDSLKLIIYNKYSVYNNVNISISLQI